MALGKGYFFKFIVFIGIVVYVLLGSYHVRPGDAYIKSWSMDVESAQIEKGTVDAELNQKWIPFRVEEYFGYTDEDGSLLLRSPVMWNVAVSDTTYCNYSRTGDDLVIRDPIHDYLYPLNIKGYPVARNGSYYILRPDATGISAVSTTGEFSFQKEFSSMITSVDANQSFVGIGLLNGGLELFNKDGTYHAGIKPNTGRINVIYGAALSSQSNIIGLVHGIDPQFLSLYQMEGSDFQLLHQIEVNDPSRSHTLLKFSPDGKFVLCETAAEVMLLSSIEPYEEVSLSVKGKIVDFEFVPQHDSVFILSNEDDRAVLYMFTEGGRLFSKEVFYGKPEWLSYSDKALYLGAGTRLQKISIARSGK